MMRVCVCVCVCVFRGCHVKTVVRSISIPRTSVVPAFASYVCHVVYVVFESPSKPGSHVYRFVANINGSSSSVPQIGDVSAYLADGTELVFLASELTFLKPLASAATGAAAMTADTTFAALAGPISSVSVSGFE
jgi:hypothetical protein